MVPQTTPIAPNGSPAAQASRNARHIVRDLFELSELQVRLALADFRESKRALVLGAVLVGIGSLAVVAALPVALMALADALVTAGFSEAIARLLAAATGLVLAVLMFLLGWRSLRHAVGVYRRSGTELTHNVRWFKDVLSGD